MAGEILSETAVESVAKELARKMFDEMKYLYLRSRNEGIMFAGKRKKGEERENKVNIDEELAEGRRVFLVLRKGNFPPEINFLVLLDIGKGTQEGYWKINGAARKFDFPISLDNYDCLLRLNWQVGKEEKIVAVADPTGGYDHEILDEKNEVVGGLVHSEIRAGLFGYREVFVLPQESEDFERAGLVKSGLVLASQPGFFRDLGIGGLSPKEEEILFGENQADDMILSVAVY